MKELEYLLYEREMSIVANFDQLKNRVRCYAHIINVCSSHIISSVASASKRSLSNFPVDSSPMIVDDSEDEWDSDEIDPGCNIDELELADCFADCDSSDLEDWLAGIKRDPLGRARRIIRLLRSSDQRREGFRRSIQEGNERNWFSEKTPDGNRRSVQVPELQLLRDVKTRWDSVYMMLQRLRVLRPVSLSQRLDTSITVDANYVFTRLLIGIFTRICLISPTGRCRILIGTSLRAWKRS